MKRVGIWILMLIILAGAVGGFLWIRSRPPQDTGQNILRTAKVVQGTLEITIAASGNVAANKTIELRFDTPGTVASISADVGDHVKAGQELARLDTADLERAVRQAEIALAQAQLNLDQLTKPVDEKDVELARLAVQSAAQSMEVARIGKQSAQAQADDMMVQAQRAFDRAFDAYQDAKGTPFEDRAKQAFDEAEGQRGITQVNAELKIQQAQDQWLAAYNRYQQAVQDLDKLKQGADEDQIRQVELQVEQAKLSLQQAQENLANTAIEAPFDAIVATINIQENAQPSAALPAVVLIDDSQFYVDVTIDETDIGKLSMNQPVSITLDAYPDLTLDGAVDSIAPAASNIGGVVSYPVRIRLAKTDAAEVRDGMTASVVVRASKIENVLLVPNWAIRTDQTTGETYAYLVQDNVPQRLPVSTGQRNETFTEITSGLKEGDTVALVTEERNLFEFSGPPSPGQ